MSEINLFEYSRACSMLSADSDSTSNDVTPSKGCNPRLEKFRASIRNSLFIENTTPSNSRRSSAKSRSSIDNIRLLTKAKSIFEKNEKLENDLADRLSTMKRTVSMQENMISFSSNNSPDISPSYNENEPSPAKTNMNIACFALNESSTIDESPKGEQEASHLQIRMVDPQAEDDFSDSDSQGSIIEEENNTDKDEELENSFLKHCVFLRDTISGEIQELKDEFDIQEDSNIYFVQGNFGNHYKEDEVLGEGASGLVKKCSKIDTNERFAVKIIQYRGDKELLTSIIHEFQNLKKLDHKNVIKVYELYIDTCKKKVYTIMELANCREMFDVLVDMGHFSEAIASGIIKQILTGLNYLHSHGVCHRDIKPNNILVSKDGEIVKIADFNVSKFCDNQDLKKKYSSLSTENYKMWTHTGTIAFTAPEVFLDSEYTESVDIWSTGVVLYTMLCGYQPFQSENMQELIDSIKEGNYTFPAAHWEGISSQAKDLISHCLDPNTKTRYSPTDALMHPWIANHGKVSNVKIPFKDNFRVYYKKQKDFKNDRFCADQMKKIQVISPNLVVTSPASKLRKRSGSQMIILENLNEKLRSVRPVNPKAKELEMKRARDVLPHILEISNEESPVYRKLGASREKNESFQRRISNLTSLMLKEDLGFNMPKLLSLNSKTEMDH